MSKAPRIARIYADLFVNEIKQIKLFFCSEWNLYNLVESVDNLRLRGGLLTEEHKRHKRRRDNMYFGAYV